MCCPSSCSGDCSDSPGPEDAGPPEDASNPCEGIPEFHLHLDADRDGTVDADRSGLDTWKWGKGQKGAIILCNNDGDGAATASDNTNSKVDTGNDNTEIAPLVIRRVGGAAPAGWSATLEVSPAHKDHIRIFDGRAAGANEVIGPSKGNKFTFPDLNFAEKELGMEAVMYADGTWDGLVEIKFTLNKASCGTDVERGVVRVAPWMMPNHLDKAEKVFVVETSSVGRPPGDPDTTGDNSRYRKDLDSHVKAAGCTLQTFASNDVWMQDCMEIGFANLPGVGYRTVMRNPRRRPLRTFAATLRAADFGYHEQGTLSPFTTFDSTGNLECTPPVKSAAGKTFPWGRMYFGPGEPGRVMDADMKAFLEKQTVQEPIQVDTSFLAVGHVDEMISIVPGPGKQGFKLLLASPKTAFDILNSNKAKNGSSKLLIGRKFPIFNAMGTAITGWKSAEVTIKDFLDVGITAMSLTKATLKKINDKAQAAVDKARALLIKEMGLDAGDIIDVPILYTPNDDLPDHADALSGGMVNMLVINKHCVVPKPFGPVVGGKDLFEEDLQTKLGGMGLTIHILDDWYEYHVANGEVHCSTNTLRSPTKADWWEFSP